MPGALGLECSATIGGSSLLAVLSGSGNQFSIGARPIIAGSAASPLQGLIGYAPSTSARSQFSLHFKIPYDVGSGVFTAILSATPQTVALGFGAAGGISIGGALCSDCQASGSEGGDIEGTATFISITLPTPGSGGSPVSADYFKFSDVISATYTGGSTNDLSSFTWRVTRKIAEFKGNSPTGIAKYIQIAYTEAMFDVDYLKVDDGAASAASQIPLTVSDVGVVIGGNPLFAGGSTGTLALGIAAAFHDPAPTVSGNEESFVTEKSSMKSSTGTFTIG